MKMAAAHRQSGRPVIGVTSAARQPKCPIASIETPRKYRPYKESP
jgi:hypothetical protein